LILIKGGRLYLPPIKKNNKLMNNFVFSQDPLLYATLANRNNPQTEYDMRKQLEDALTQYQAFNQPQNISNNKTQTKDYLGEIDDMISKLDKDVTLTLTSDIEYLKINEDLQKMIQEEMMKSIKWKINSNPEAITKMERLKELITSAQKTKIDEDRKIMADINDYINNYSDLTFDEYKQLKYGK
jgi:hypothetical protein